MKRALLEEVILQIVEFSITSMGNKFCVGACYAIGINVKIYHRASKGLREEFSVS